MANKSKISEEIQAAIACAIYQMQNENHDFEPGVITIKRNHGLCAWSFKASTLGRQPEVKPQTVIKK